MKTNTGKERGALAALSFLFLLLTPVVRGQSALDGFDPNANGAINVVVVQPDGKILIGGDFTTLAPNGGSAVARNRIARLNPEGTLDAGFNPNANSTVRTIALQADGRILVGGDFNGANSIGGQPRNRIARLEPIAGSADFFDPNSNNGVRSIAVQTDGKILVAGLFNGANSIGGQTRNYIARLDPMTGLADSFNPREQFCFGSRAANRWQDFGGRAFLRTDRRADTQRHRPARSRDWPGRFLQSELER